MKNWKSFLKDFKENGYDSYGLKELKISPIKSEWVETLSNWWMRDELSKVRTELKWKHTELLDLREEMEQKKQEISK